MAGRAAGKEKGSRRGIVARLNLSRAPGSETGRGAGGPCAGTTGDGLHPAQHQCILIPDSLHFSENKNKVIYPPVPMDFTVGPR